MVSQLRNDIVEAVHGRLSRILDAAAIGMPTECQFHAFRKIALDEFGNQGLLPELDSLLKRYGQGRTGQADTAGKEVPR
ncbi:hypothetical protein SAMN05660652_00572 [Propionivibrio dicarboxylicus]|uniref:Uncharacterized protein n=1 Tax=Propionivibrio dicarboxylicus TaxID=83767 RepID=A0A1G7WMM2_9RHOO|nr:hypothetical protein SAMN05660652_00572 [Propionivibrio dicarboxylicus]